MRSLVAILFTAILAWIAGIWLPWWSVAVAAAIVALILPTVTWKGLAFGFHWDFNYMGAGSPRDQPAQ